MIDKIKTGINGFDKLLFGGFPKGANILLSGSPATGKTIFGLQYLYNGAKVGEPGMYISYEETKEGLLKTVENFKWNFNKYIDEKKLILKSFQKEELFLETVLADIKRQVTGYNIKRIVIDSLTTLNFLRTVEDKNNLDGLNQNEKQNKFIYKLIMSLNQFKNITKILISEVEGDDERHLASEDASPFLCDGIIFIKYLTMGGLNTRELIVRKMRHTKHMTGFHPLMISDIGISIKGDD